MEEIRFPVPKQPPPDPEPLGMNDYVRLVQNNYRWMKKSISDMKMRKEEFVREPFRLPSS